MSNRMSRLEWSDRVCAISVNPDMANCDDIADLAADLMEARKALSLFVVADDMCDESERAGILRAATNLARDITRLDNTVREPPETSKPRRKITGWSMSWGFSGERVCMITVQSETKEAAIAMMEDFGFVVYNPEQVRPTITFSGRMADEFKDVPEFILKDSCVVDAVRQMPEGAGQ